MRLALRLFPALLAACGQAPTTSAGRTSEQPMRDSGAVCEVHAAPLRAVEVEVEYGLPMLPTRSWQAAEAALFPHATTTPNGGCVPQGGTAWVEACRSCDQVRAAWEQDHPRWGPDPHFCPLHGELLVDGRLDLLAGMYGLPTADDTGAAEMRFPYAFADRVTGSYVDGGPATIPVPYCPTCRAAREAWLDNAQKE